MTTATAQRCSTLYLRTSEKNRAAVSELVLNRLAKAKAHQASGTRDNEESVSHMLTLVREAGFTVGGHLSDFEYFLEALGFTIREHVAGRAVRRYVSL